MESVYFKIDVNKRGEQKVSLWHTDILISPHISCSTQRGDLSMEHLNSLLQHCALQLFYGLLIVILLLSKGRTSPSAVKLQRSEPIAVVLNRLYS